MPKKTPLNEGSQLALWSYSTTLTQKLIRGRHSFEPNWFQCHASFVAGRRDDSHATFADDDEVSFSEKTLKHRFNPLFRSSDLRDIRDFLSSAS